MQAKISCVLKLYKLANKAYQLHLAVIAIAMNECKYAS